MPRPKQKFSLFQKRGKFYANLYDEKGKRIQRSLKTSDRNVALKLAEELYEKANQGKAEIEVGSLGECFSRYVTYKSTVEKVSDNTLKCYVYSFRGANRILGAKTPLHRIGERELIKYIEERFEEGRKANTVRTELQFVMAALRHAHKRGSYPHDVNRFDLPNIKPTAKNRFLSADEAQRLLAHVKRDKVIGSPMGDRYPHILTYLSLGIRKNDIYKIRVRDVDLSARTLKITNSKSKKLQTLPLTDTMVEMLEKQMKYKEPDDAVFKKFSQRWTPRLRRWARELDIEDFTIHDLRRTCGSLLVSNGVSIYVVSQILGHASVVVTQRAYAHLLPSASHEAISRLPF